MSKAKDVLKEIATTLGFNKEEMTDLETVLDTTTEETVIKAEFVEAQLADGTAVQIEPDVAVGAVVAIEDPEAGFIPVPAGSYELADGRIIVVEDGGVISEVQEVAEEEMETETTEEAPVMTGDEVKKIIESVTTVFNEQLNELKKEMDDLQINFQKATEENTELNAKFFVALEDIASQPGAEPTQPRKVNNPFFDKARANGIENLNRYKNK